MKEEILSIADNAFQSIDDLENYLFNNKRSKYIIFKNILDEHRQHILDIKSILSSELNEQNINDIKADLEKITTTVNDAKTTGELALITKDENSTINSMLNDLNTDKIETVFPNNTPNIEAITAFNPESALIDNSINISSEIPQNPEPEIVNSPEIINQEIKVPDSNGNTDAPVDAFNIDINSLNGILNSTTENIQQ